MRRGRPEWLVLPLFLLPLGVAAVLCLDARSRYEATMARARREGRDVAEEWLRDPTGGRGWARRFAEDLGRLEAGPAVPLRFEPLSPGDPPALAHCRGAGEPWKFAARYPGSLPAIALRDPDVRLAVEAGTPPAALDCAEPEAKEFHALVEAPDLARLREAPLPAATKLFLARQWPGGREVGDILALAAEAASAGGGSLPPLPLGIHRLGGVTALSYGRPDFSTRLLPPAERAPGGYEETDPDGNLRLVYEPRGERPALWRGRLEAPLAGEWALESVHGAAWWKDARFRRWAGPLGAGLLLFLSLPAALLVALRRQRRLDEARSRFLTEVAHDLRTPLTSVRLHAEMLASGRAPTGEEARYTGVLARESARLSGLLGNLLDLSRLDRGSRVFQPERVPLREAAEEAVRDFQVLYPDRAADVRAEGGDEAAEADRTALARCLGNLLDNAGKFTAKGTRIDLSWARANGGLALRVADEGPGIPARERGAVFRRYARGARAANVPGTGVGLALVRELVEGMGGRVRLVDTARGACFELDLPEASDG
jgi:signal transduction histidine kinase